MTKKEIIDRRKWQWAIKLRSRYTGDEIVLGARYKSQKDAEKAARQDVCSRCNTWSVFPYEKK